MGPLETTIHTLTFHTYDQYARSHNLMFIYSLPAKKATITDPCPPDGSFQLQLQLSILAPNFIIPYSTTFYIAAKISGTLRESTNKFLHLIWKHNSSSPMGGYI